MDVTVLTLKLLSIYLVISGLFLLFKGKTVPHLLKDFFDHPSVVYLTGIILVFLSVMYLIQYNIWDGTWRTLVSLFVWVILVKGLVYIFSPKSLSVGVVSRNKTTFVIYGVIAVVVGVYMFFLQ